MTAQRVAIVTGGSRGIGRAAVRRLAADGFAVVVGYAGNRTEAEAAVAEAGEHAIAVQADNVVSFLAGPDGRWVNGQVLRANGGIV